MSLNLRSFAQVPFGPVSADLTPVGSLPQHDLMRQTSQALGIIAAWHNSNEQRGQQGGQTVTWIIIGLILVAAFGPVLWLKPSGRDKRLNALRQAARNAGLTVDIKPLVKLNPTAQERVSAGGEERDSTRLVARYSRHLEKPLRVLSGWQVVAQPLSQESNAVRPAIQVAPGWVFDPTVEFPPESGWPGSLKENLSNLEKLPKGILGVVLERRLVGVFWDENASVNAADVAIVGQVLAAVEAQLLALDEQLLVSEGDENS